jgi:hypothetical protein
MFGLRAVAGFAVYMRMFAGLLYVRYVRVAGFACIVTSELNGMRGDFADCGSAIVPILSKALWDNEMTHHQKHQKGENEKPSKPEKMPCIFEDTHQDLSTTTVPGGSAAIPM